MTSRQAPPDSTTNTSKGAGPESEPRCEPLAGLSEIERELGVARRVIAGVPLDAPSIGLALSGGGVRSATFGLGLLRGLAQCGQLPRIDVLSTVSGGGYIGAMFGRLVLLVGIAQAQALLSSADSPVLAWLRRNGRYLSPSGSRDIGMTIVTYLRAFIAIHGEFLALSVPFALLVIGPHLWRVTTDAPFDAVKWLPWHTLWWPLAAALWCGGAPGLMASYWSARDTGDPGARHLLPPWRDLVFATMSLGGLAVYWFFAGPQLPSIHEPLTAGTLLLVSLTSAAIGLTLTNVMLALTEQARSTAVAKTRHFSTGALRALSLVAALAFVFGALDLVSWWLLVEMHFGRNWIWSSFGVGLGGAVILVLRALAQPMLQLAQQMERDHARSNWGLLALKSAGVLGAAMLITFWIFVVQLLIFAPAPVDALRDYAPATRAWLLLYLSLFWLLMTAGSAQMPNTSSLHSFYRARLNRAYLAVGNRARGIALPVDDGNRDVTDVVLGDDMALANYQPEVAGGPIHLINVCLNQTRDDASGLYNADRKGALLTASARGFEIGQRGWIPLGRSSDVGTVGRWIATSGAAATPGAGAYTSRGWALMLYFLGLRLGYWMASPFARAARSLHPSKSFLWRAAGKHAMLWSEATATFFGMARPWWYLSDGGHFDNTGVYPLLKRKLDFIILSDAGADPEYEFADLENLVRKARIDLGVEIDFYTREEAASLFNPPSPLLTVLSPEDLANNHSARGVLLARVRYQVSPMLTAESRREGTLLIIKPNLHDALDVDLLAYAQRHPRFPHEGTADQSFDEPQWESYQRLGEDFGRRLRSHWLEQLPGWQRVPALGDASGVDSASGLLAHPIEVAARLGRTDHLSGKQLQPLVPEPLWRRAPKTAAIGATIGVTALGSLVLSTFQVRDQLQKNQEMQLSEVKALFSEVAKDMKAFNPECPVLSPTSVAPLLILDGLRSREALAPLESYGLRQMSERLWRGCDVLRQRQEADILKIQQPHGNEGSENNCPASAFEDYSRICSALVQPSEALSYWQPVIGIQKDIGDVVVDLFRQPDHSPKCGADLEPLSDSVRRLCGPFSGYSIAGPAQSLRFETKRPTRDTSGRCAFGEQLVPNYSYNGRPPVDMCRSGSVLSLRTQVYDEDSRRRASHLLADLSPESGNVFIAAPVQDVMQNAVLRQVSQPVPWPQPTIVLHGVNEEDLRCGVALASYVACGWVDAEGQPSEPRFRRLPASLRERDRVIELWLPGRN